MNTFFTSKSRALLLLLIISSFGLKLYATTPIKMVCKLDTPATKKAKSRQLIKADTTLVLKAGSTIVKNADTILIINGVPHVKAHKKKHKKHIVAPSTKVDTASKSVTTIAQPVDGNIQVKTIAPPTNTTIIAPPTDGVIEVRGTPTQQPTQQPATNGAGNNGTGNNGAGQGKSTDPNASDAAKKDTGGANGSSSDAAGTKADSAKNTNKSKTDSLKKNDTSLMKKGDTSLLKKDTSLLKKDTSLLKLSDTTAMKSDTTEETIVKATGAFLEVGGAGLAISANYDTRFGKARDGWGYRIGVGAFVSDGNSVITIPFQVNYLIGGHTSMLEVGAGTTFLNSKGNSKGKTFIFDNITGFIATTSIGYRYQPESKGINFRIAFTPLLTGDGVIPAGGISFGYTFK